MRGADLTDTSQLLDHLHEELARCARRAASIDDSSGEPWALCVDLTRLVPIVEVLRDRHKFGAADD